MRIVITGGPCAGKTTMIDTIRHTEIAGHKIIAIPESATILRNAGAWDDDLVKFQTSVLKLQMTMEDLADMEGAVQVCDRGCLDGGAYVDDFNQIMESIPVDLDRLMRRYDAVIHFQTAAVNGYFTAENNSARLETTAEQALAADARCQKIWSEHPRFYFVNGASVDEKISKATWLISRILKDARQ